MNRRDLLQALGTAGMVGLAGCNTDLNGSDTAPSSPTLTATSSPTSTPTETPTETETTPEWEIDPVEHDKLVGAYYYGWYREGDWDFPPPSTPVLGEYSSRDEDVINQHIKWAREHGINTFIYRWGGPDAWDDTTLTDHLLEVELGDRIDFMIQPSVSSLYPGDDYEWGEPIDFDKPRNRKHLRDLFRYMNDEFFGRSNYARLDGRPAVTFFGLGFAHDGDLGGALAEAKEVASDTPFLVGDIADIFDQGADLWMENADVVFNGLLPELDAVTTYTIYEPDKVKELDFDRYRQHVGRLGLHRRLGSHSRQVGFIPSVMPGYDDSQVPGRPEGRPPLEPTPSRFERLIDSQTEYVDPDLDAVFVTSFNEWYEDTSVEPRDEFGGELLDVAAENIATAQLDVLDVDAAYDRIRIAFNTTVTPEGSDRDLAWMIGDLDLYDESGSRISDYDIGDPAEEPILLHGAYPPEHNPDSSVPYRRWFGGPTGESILYIPATENEPTTAQVVGYPVRADQIEADIYFNGERTDHVALGDPDGFGTYTVSLTG